MKPLTGKYDKHNALLAVYAGAGGDDAKDWADMLVKMYAHYADNRSWRAAATDDRALEIKGDYVFGTLKKEAGVHRLVRLSPFSAKKLRHTSFALVEVIPELEELEEKIRAFCDKFEGSEVTGVRWYAVEIFRRLSKRD